MVADPLTLYDAAQPPMASAVILVADHLAHKFTDTPVWVKGSGAGSDTLRSTTGQALRNYEQHNLLHQRPTKQQASLHLMLI